MSNNRPKIALFGHFGAGNFGNESTLWAMLYHLRRLLPNADLRCICTAPERVAALYDISTVASREAVVKPWSIRNPVARWIRKVAIGLPSELYRWVKGFQTLRGTDALIVPGTGLLTDAYTVFYWGPYEMFRWSVTAKLCRCKLLFVSVGAGPIYGRLSRLLVKAALSLADFRSYRDESSAQYLRMIGFKNELDPVCPDLAFSLPVQAVATGNIRRSRQVVGIGLMEYAGRYSVEEPVSATYTAYLNSLAAFVKWLLEHEYNVRLLIGDMVDTPVVEEFKLLLASSAEPDANRIIDEPVESVEDLLSQIAATDFVVATRFHNVLLSLLLNKPVIAIAFHHKCSSLMQQMGLSDYCEDINDLTAEGLIKQFCQLQQNVADIKQLTNGRLAVCREALDEQYANILQKVYPGSQFSESTQEVTCA